MRVIASLDPVRFAGASLVGDIDIKGKSRLNVDRPGPILGTKAYCDLYGLEEKPRFHP